MFCAICQAARHAAIAAALNNFSPELQACRCHQNALAPQPPCRSRSRWAPCHTRTAPQRCCARSGTATGCPGYPASAAPAHTAAVPQKTSRLGLKCISDQISKKAHQERGVVMSYTVECGVTCRDSVGMLSMAEFAPACIDCDRSSPRPAPRRSHHRSASDGPGPRLPAPASAIPPLRAGSAGDDVRMYRLPAFASVAVPLLQTIEPSWHLALCDVGGPCGEPQPLAPHRNGAAADNHNPVTYISMPKYITIVKCIRNFRPTGHHCRIAAMPGTCMCAACWYSRRGDSWDRISSHTLILQMCTLCMKSTCSVEVAHGLAYPRDVAEVEAVLLGAHQAGCANLDHLSSWNRKRVLQDSRAFLSNT